MNDWKKKLAHKFLETGVFKINTNQMFELASGKLSPLYFDHRIIFSIPSLRELLVNEWAKEIKNRFCNFDSRITPKISVSEKLIIAGTMSAGIAPAYALAHELNVGFAYVRTQPKGHGLAKQWEGSLPKPEQSIVLIDDMITTGKSVSLAANGVKKICETTGADFLGISCITSHPFVSTKSKFSEILGLDKIFYSCFESTNLVKLAFELNMISEIEFKVCTDWIKEQE